MPEGPHGRERIPGATLEGSELLERVEWASESQGEVINVQAEETTHLKRAEVGDSIASDRTP